MGITQADYDRKVISVLPFYTNGQSFGFSGLMSYLLAF